MDEGVALPVETEDALYISEALMMDWLWNFCHDNREYKKPRRFGVKAEFIEMTRKLDKLEGPLWNGEDTTDWRETPRKVLQELISHAFLALVSMDKEAGIDVTNAQFRLVCVEQHHHGHRSCWGVANGPARPV